MSYKELAAYEKKVESMSKQLEELESEREAVYKEWVQVERSRNDMIIIEATGGQKADEKTLAKLRETAEALNSKIGDYDFRIDLIKSNRKSVLAELLGDLHKGYEREMDKLRKEAAGQFVDAIKIGHEYLLQLKRVGEVKQKASQLHQRFIENTKLVSTDYEDRYNFGYTWIDTTLFSDNDGYAIGVREKEQTQALSGHVRPGVLLYELNGEVVGKDHEAKDKIREIGGRK